MRVVVFGHSDSPERYANMAHDLLLEYGHESVAINPRRPEELEYLNSTYDTLTLYVGEKISDKFARELLASRPKRVIINPGAENEVLEQKFLAQGSEVLHACTLVMLKTNQFE